MFGLTAVDIDSIIKVLKSYPKIEEAIIYGSRAMGNYKPGSDIDLALKGQLDENDAISVSVDLNERLPLPYKFDVLAYSTLSNKALIEHIDHQGVAFFRPSAIL